MQDKHHKAIQSPDCLMAMREKKNLKGHQKKKSDHIQREPHQANSRFPAETLQARRDWGPIFSILKKFQPIFSYCTNLSFINKGEIKSFPDKQAVREFVTTRSALQQKLKGVLNIEQKKDTSYPRNTRKYTAHRPYKASTQVKTTKQPANKFTIRSKPHVFILTLNANDLNDPSKRYRIASWIPTKPFHLLSSRDPSHS